MSAYTITIQNGHLVAGQLDAIRASVDKVIRYIDQFIDWAGSLDILVDVATHQQAIERDYAARYNGDVSRYPNGLLPSILGFTGTGVNERTVALSEAITGLDANGGSAELGFSLYLGTDGQIRNYGTPAFFDSGTNYESYSAVPPGTFDFASVALHEILHGMGFAIGAGQFRSFLQTENGNPAFASAALEALIGEGIPFTSGQDHYGLAPVDFAGRTGPVQAGAMYISGDYEQNRWMLGAADLALLKSLGWNVTATGPMPLFDTNDRFNRELTTGDDVHNGAAGSERISALAGNDRIVLSTTDGTGDANGNDFVDGGDGIDTVVYAGVSSDYDILLTQGMVVVRNSNPADGRDGTDALVNVEKIEFADRTVTLAGGSTVLSLTGPRSEYSIVFDPVAGAVDITDLTPANGNDSAQDVRAPQVETIAFADRTISTNARESPFLLDSPVVALGQAVSGGVEQLTELEQFRVGLTAGRTYEIDVQTSSPTPVKGVTVTYRIFDQNGTLIAQSTPGSSGTFTPTASGDYVFQIEAASTSVGNYSVRVQEDNAPPGWYSHTVDLEVVASTYQFFTDRVPEKAGFIYLVSSPDNDHDLNDAYYAQFNRENRFINFANNLGTQGEGREAFNALFGSLSYEQTIRNAFEMIISANAIIGDGGNPEDSITFFMNARFFYEAVARERVVSSGLSLELATKVVAIGSILNEALKSGLGPYADAIEKLVADVSPDGESGLFGKDLFATV